MLLPHTAGEWSYNLLLLRFKADTESTCSLFSGFHSERIRSQLLILIFYSFLQVEYRQSGCSTFSRLSPYFPAKILIFISTSTITTGWGWGWRGRVLRSQVRGGTRYILIHFKGQITVCFKSLRTGAEILIFAAQEHYQRAWSEATIIINESHFQATVLDVQSAFDLQRESEAQRCLLSGVSRLNVNNLLQFSNWSLSSPHWFVYLSACALDDLFMNMWKITSLQKVPCFRENRLITLCYRLQPQARTSYEIAFIT